MFGPKGPFCQSCGMPLSKDENGGGSEQDGSLSSVYCSRCYVKGAFTKPGMTLDEMQTLVKEKLKSMGFPGVVAWFFTRAISKLERWKK